MTIKVLVVDDSSFFRRRMSEIINGSPFLEVIAIAKNGQEAIDMVIKYKPDVVTMDVEMPVMDGITAVKRIMAIHPLPILMFSSLTQQGARSTFDALAAGACDFLPKKFEDIARDKQEAILLLQQRIQAIAMQSVGYIAERTIASIDKRTLLDNVAARELQKKQQCPRYLPTNRADPIPLAKKRFRASGKSYDVIAIGTSTGGPVALQEILTALPSDFKLPIILLQHMPGTFTKAFAERLNDHCQITVKEAANGDLLKSGCAYLAPGGKQMMVTANGKIKINAGNDTLNYKPSVDVTFASLAKSYENKVLAIVLTGMGADGRNGARLLKDKGAEIWTQSEASCVVYGMPRAIVQAGLSSESLPLNQIAKRILVELANE